jgi:hypothetical protein
MRARVLCRARRRSRRPVCQRARTQDAEDAIEQGAMASPQSMIRVESQQATTITITRPTMFIRGAPTDRLTVRVRMR